MATNTAGKPAKTVFKVDSPYTTVTWPQIAPTDQAIMLDMLCSLLAPIGRHRAAHYPPPKSKSSKKRKRLTPAKPDAIITDFLQLPPMPEVSKFLTIGLNSTTRHLETLMASATGNKQEPPSTVEEPPVDGPDAQHTAVIFLPKSRNDLIYAHLPLMSRTASTLRPRLAATRLVPLNPTAETRIAAALGLPRAGVVGVLEGAPGSELLAGYVRQHVQPVEVPWIEEATRGEYLPLQTQTEVS